MTTHGSDDMSDKGREDLQKCGVSVSGHHCWHALTPTMPLLTCCFCGAQERDLHGPFHPQRMETK